MNFSRYYREAFDPNIIELQVNAKNKAAYKIYSDYGFTNKSINMELL